MGKARNLLKMGWPLELLRLISDSSLRLLCGAQKGQTSKSRLQKHFLVLREVIGQTVPVLVPVCTP